ncbi:uncharacterized protein LOC127256277 [Andrographis paniculata]|uniref:uncharacterized protein LOC127256277 n=1 Tax=Andrographis paniculata TaxID=175694 RepID=UPI0021E85E91|nr:uncharacterized protein LOC127256277 [Andrographis paniculata]XP_051138151.1 uncharacterized protein LOC127256277 [Andrographis paniculata]
MGCEHPEWLPAGWKIEVKAQSSGEKHTCYVNPANGLEFSSKLEVLRYLESSVKDDNSNDPNKLCAEGEGQVSITVVVADESSPDKMGNSGLKLATDVNCDATNVAKGQMPLSEKADESLSCNKMGKSGSKAALLRTGERRRSPRLAANKLKEGASRDPSLFQTGGAAEKVAATTATITVPETMNRPKPTETEQIPVDGQQGLSLSAKKTRGSKRKWASDLPRRTSKRLAGIKVDIESDLKPARVNRKAVASKEPEHDAERESIDDQKMPPIDSETTNIADNDEQKMPQIDTERKTDDGQNADDNQPNLPWIDGNKEEEGDGSKKSDEKLRQIVMDDPCIAFAVKILTGEIPVENFTKGGADTVKSHSQSPAVGDQGQGQGKDLQ